MLSIEQVIATLNRMRADAVIEDYAIGGAVGAFRTTVPHRSAMTFDLEAVLASKRRHRQHLAALPIVEKLRLLDALRERTRTIRRAGVAAQTRGAPRADPSAPENPPHRDTRG